MTDKHLKRIIAQTSAIICLLAIAALFLSLIASKHTPPLRYAADLLVTIAAGINVYFLFNWLRALTQPNSRWATVFVGVAWLVVSAAVSFVVAVLGFAECAGGCAAHLPSATDWYGGLAILGVGVVFNGLLYWVRSFLGDPIRPR
jgi:glucan phosphoethanolaminetransferase (alkaline phosphatase superfamily)